MMTHFNYDYMLGFLLQNSCPVLCMGWVVLNCIGKGAAYGREKSSPYR